MKPHGDCPSDEELALFDEGGVPPAEAGVLEGHLAGCAFCRERWAALAAAEVEAAPFDVAVVADRAAQQAAGDRGVGWRAWGMAAAAVVALSMVSMAVLREKEGSGKRFTIPGGTRVAGQGEVFRTEARSFQLVETPDGSRFRIGGGSEVRFAPSGAGERVRVEMARGVLEAEVTRGGGRV